MNEREQTKGYVSRGFDRGTLMRISRDQQTTYGRSIDLRYERPERPAAEYDTEEYLADESMLAEPLPKKSRKRWAIAGSVFAALALVVVLSAVVLGKPGKPSASVATDSSQNDKAVAVEPSAAKAASKDSGSVLSAATDTAATSDGGPATSTAATSSSSALRPASVARKTAGSLNTSPAPNPVPNPVPPAVPPVNATSPGDTASSGAGSSSGNTSPSDSTTGSNGDSTSKDTTGSNSDKTVCALNQTQCAPVGGGGSSSGNADQSAGASAPVTTN